MHCSKHSHPRKKHAQDPQLQTQSDNSFAQLHQFIGTSRLHAAEAKLGADRAQQMLLGNWRNQALNHPTDLPD